MAVPMLVAPMSKSRISIAQRRALPRCSSFFDLPHSCFAFLHLTGEFPRLSGVDLPFIGIVKITSVRKPQMLMTVFPGVYRQKAAGGVNEVITLDIQMHACVLRDPPQQIRG